MSVLRFVSVLRWVLLWRWCGMLLMALVLLGERAVG